MNHSKDFLTVGALAVVLSFVLFGNGISGDFVFDDTIVIVGNPLIDSTLGGFWEIFISPYFAYQPRPGLYRPLTIASYSFNALIFGTSPVSFHVVNVLLHALASFLVFALAYHLAGKIAAFASFLFFIFLPIHVEAVTSIVGRAEILSLLFVVGALLFSLRKKYILASGLFFLGLLSKEMAIVFLPTLLFLELSRNSFSRSQASGERVSFKDIWGKYYYFASVLAVYGVLRYVALGEYFLKNDATLVYNPIKFSPLLVGLATSFKVFCVYLKKTFFPLSLSIDYSFSQISLVENLFVSTEAVFGTIILGLVILLFFKTKDFLLRLGIVIFLSSYFIISNWVFKTGTIMAERLMYTPSLGLALIFGSVIAGLAPKVKKSKVFYGFLLLVLVFYGLVILNRNKDWLNDKNLYESAYTNAPNSIVNQTNKAYLDFINKNYEEAERRLDEILQMTPEHVPALNLAGQNYKKLGQYQKAEKLWKKAINLRVDYLRAYLSLGVLYYENGYFNSAEKVLTEAIDIYPRWSEVLFLALTKVSLDKPDEAILLINRFSERESLRKELKFALGWAHFNKGDKEMALKYFTQVKDPKVSIDDFIKTFEGSKVVILGEF